MINLRYNLFVLVLPDSSNCDFSNAIYSTKQFAFVTVKKNDAEIHVKKSTFISGLMNRNSNVSLYPCFGLQKLSM